MAVTSLTATTPEQTATAGEALGRTLGPGDVVALYGELGTGKTCFVQGLVRGLGVTTQATSPTFVLVNEYRGRLPVHHVDAYRTGGLAELMDLGLLDLIGGDGVTLLEWADRAEPLLPSRAVRVRIEGLGDEPRAVTIEDPRGLT
ncbi:MAG TPA: tRNA (adenosine(37)-N6)-threonylcarbamoyltransferase complex ATPase subunit type 1 TsaE [Patescibacteria group bacterium]|nr:tRNA (adenosine(37)-N6)-threonylcarbamoyltransferase complex ATPase subunit type 1 TsaE [Patescibacteria group bacterium]